MNRNLTPVAYRHDGNIYCNECLSTELIGGGGVDVERVLDLMAEARATTRDDPDLPQYVYADNPSEDEHLFCVLCNTDMIWG